MKGGVFMNHHLHKYKFESMMSKDHKHRISGYSEGMIGINSFHFHFFNGISSYKNHTHYYSGITGFSIKTENGHKHKIEGTLEANNMHEHKFSNYTNEDVSYHSDRLKHEAYI
jgi:hypothetical protein